MTRTYYDNHAPRLAKTYESLEAARLNAWFADSLPDAPACVLDVGAGSGRDAAWLAGRGYDVVAVEPSPAMVREAARYHPQAPIHWIEGDSLPGLERTLRLGKAFDFILLSAVWMHVSPGERLRAFRKLVSLMKPGGRLAISLRHGPGAEGQTLHPVSAAEIEALCRAHGAYVERAHHEVPDLGGRAEVTWTQLIIRLPDDGTGALPLLRHIILNDSKETTYKLALLRSLCRIADGSAGYARPVDDDRVALPLGLLGLCWLRLFKPLLARGLPQSADNVGTGKLGFVKESFLALQSTSHLDLRIGMTFPADTAATLHAALRDAVTTLVSMPARYITYGDGARVFDARRSRTRAPPGVVRLDAEYLRSFGEFFVPLTLWMAFQRNTVWIEPAIEAEWVRLMQHFARGQARNIEERMLFEAMRWPDPKRDVALARSRALDLMDRGSLHCVWSGKRLRPASLDIDHCLPWAVWSCDDLWNMLPTHRAVNGRKSDRLPSSERLRSSQTAIQEWWRSGYCSAEPVIRTRFETEARATLPSLDAAAVTPDEVFSGLLLQQMRLRHDQQAPVWHG